MRKFHPVMMTAIICGLLIAATPSYAATIRYYDADISLDFGNGYAATGNIRYVQSLIVSDEDSPFYHFLTGNLYFNDIPELNIFHNGLPYLSCFPCISPGHPPWPYGYRLYATVDGFGEDYHDSVLVELFAGRSKTQVNLFDFLLNGSPPIGGNIQLACVDGCTATPLPAALPLFASGIVGLTGVSIRKSRRRPAKPNTLS